jgi:hypothetical protein
MRLIAIIISAMFSLAAYADTYNLTAGCTDPLMAGQQPDGSWYAPVYDWEWRVNGGTSTAVSDQPSCALAVAGMTAAPADTIEVRAAPRNTYDGCADPECTGPWTAWLAASAPYAATHLADPVTGMSLVIIRQ